MIEAEWLALQRAAFLAGPLAAAVALLLIIKPRPREAVAALVGFLWQLPALLALHLLAGALLNGFYLCLSWWAIMRGMPAGIMSLLGALQPLMVAVASHRPDSAAGC